MYIYVGRRVKNNYKSMMECSQLSFCFLWPLNREKVTFDLFVRGS